MPRYRPIIVLLAFLLPAATAFAQTPPSATLMVQGQQLVLNGYGEREQWWIDVYRCALYLTQRTSSLAVIRHPDTAKAIRIRVLFDDIPDAMPKRWRTIFAEELSRRTFRRLRIGYRDLGRGDVLTFSYAPGKGTAIRANGEILFTDPGHDLMLELIDQWLGPRPVSRNLKRLLLG